MYLRGMALQEILGDLDIVSLKDIQIQVEIFFNVYGREIAEPIQRSARNLL